MADVIRPDKFAKAVPPDLAPPRSMSERQRSAVEALARLELVAAEIESLRHLIIDCIGDLPEGDA